MFGFEPNIEIQNPWNKMPSEIKSMLATQTEKPQHFSYLKDFRVDQCQQFLQHKCTQHRPYTCFNWHFMNQKRRRPIRRRDGTFNYSPDVYCTKYDEITGICPDNDECPFLHRTAGDTERRYHLRYYKTGMCVHDTDSRGFCVKNGQHCAFAHGMQDLRSPVYDIRELQGIDNSENDGQNGFGPNSLDKERNMVNDDPRWQDANYVLANYKTEPCKRPPRLCRQGYACPQYHNNRDKRRSPKKYKYRSTPCPNVKQGDEWGDPNNCDNGDSCQYCHTRTEQQFHPEIYKSTKCNDMQQTSYCPRGAFCAFAHVDQEIVTSRDLAQPDSTSLADILTNVLGPVQAKEKDRDKEKEKERKQSGEVNKLGDHMEPLPMNHILPKGRTPHFSGPAGLDLSAPILEASGTQPSSLLTTNRAPGSEREDKDNVLRKLHSLDNDLPLHDSLDKVKRKPGLLFPYSTSSMGLPMSLPSNRYPVDTLDYYVGNSGFEDLNLDEPLGIGSSLERDLDLDSNSVGGLSGSSPVNIPGSVPRRHHLSGGLTGNLSPSIDSPIASSLFSSQLQSSVRNDPSLDHGSSFFMGQGLMNLGSNSTTSRFGSFPSVSSGVGTGGLFDFSSHHNMSPNNRTGLTNPMSTLSQSPLVSNIAGALASNSLSEMQRLKEELASNRAKLSCWEEGIKQARNACEAWKREAEESNCKAKQAALQKDEILAKYNSLQKEAEQLQGGPCLHALRRNNDLEYLSLELIKSLQSQLKGDLDKIEKALPQLSSSKCIRCHNSTNGISVLPCSHTVLCRVCVSGQTDCPLCHTPISSS